MAKAKFHKLQRVFVKPVGTWAHVEAVVPKWVKGCEEPIKIAYDCGMWISPLRRTDSIPFQPTVYLVVQRLGSMCTNPLASCWDMSRKTLRRSANDFQFTVVFPLFTRGRLVALCRQRHKNAKSTLGRSRARPGSPFHLPFHSLSRNGMDARHKAGHNASGMDQPA